MVKRVIELTSIYMRKGMMPIEAREKAIKRDRFEREVKRIKPEENMPVKGI